MTTTKPKPLPHDVVREALTELEAFPGGIEKLLAARGHVGHACDSGRCPVAKFLLEALAEERITDINLSVGADSVTLTRRDALHVRPWRMEVHLPVPVAEWIEQYDLGRHPDLII